MKKQYIQPQMLVVKMNLTGSLMSVSTVNVSSNSYQEGQEDLSRESVWGNEEGEESKFWF